MTTILHRYPEWLPLTMTWLNQLIRDTDPYVRNRILSELRLPGSPTHSGLFVSREANPVAYWASRVLRKANALTHIEPDTSFVKRLKPNIFHSHFGHIGSLDSSLARRYGIPHIVSFYGMDVHQLPYQDSSWIPRYKALFETDALILCEGGFMRESIIRLGARPDRVRVHRLGVDIGRLPFQPRRVGVGESLKILMASSFRPKKGIPYGIAAVAKAAETVPVELTIIGGATSESERIEESRILKAIADAKIGSRIRLLGYQTPQRLADIAASHHVYLAPSVTAIDGDCEGGIPVSLIEMGASGMVIISSRHCDIPAVVSHGRTGFLADERDVAAMANHLKQVWAQRADWGAMQVAMRQHIEREYNHAVQARELIGIYTEIGR